MSKKCVDEIGKGRRRAFYFYGKTENTASYGRYPVGKPADIGEREKSAEKYDSKA